MLNASVPDEINIEITSRCNMDCIFCPLGVCSRKKQDLPNESVQKILNELVDLKTKNVDIPPITFHCLGEPLLNKHLDEYMSFCDKNEITYWLVTNGLLFSDERCDKLFDHSFLQKLEISFHTISDDSLKLRWGGEKSILSFDKYTSIVKKAVFNHKRVENNITIQIDVMYDKNLFDGRLFKAFNEDDFQSICSKMSTWAEELINQYPSLKDQNKAFYKKPNKITKLDEAIIYRNINDIPKSLFEDLPDNILWLSWEFAPKVFLTLKKFFIFTPNESYLNRISKNQYTFSIEEAHNFKCRSANSIIILSNGDISFCCLDYEGELSCGNISNMSIKDAWTSEKRKILLESPDKCEYCRKCFGRKTIIN